MGGPWNEEFPLQDSLVVEFISVTTEGKAPEYKIGQDGSAAREQSLRYERNAPGC